MRAWQVGLVLLLLSGCPGLPNHADLQLKNESSTETKEVHVHVWDRAGATVYEDTTVLEPRRWVRDVATLVPGETYTVNVTTQGLWFHEDVDIRRSSSSIWIYIQEDGIRIGQLHGD